MLQSKRQSRRSFPNDSSSTYVSVFSADARGDFRGDDGTTSVFGGTSTGRDNLHHEDIELKFEISKSKREVLHTPYTAALS